MIQPQYDESTRFLLLLYPEGPWTLTSVEPDRKGIATRTFRLIEDVVPWLEEHGEFRNIYYALNPLLGPVTKKAERANVLSLAWLHVDLDPRAGEDLDEERARTLGLLRSPPSGLLLPTGIVDSGGGHNGLWRLRDPFPIRGDLEKAEEAKLYNLQLEIMLGADACHNVDRILRLPGTLNRPGARKREKGRRLALAELVEWHEDRVYDLAQFMPAPKVQEAGDGGVARDRIEISANVQRLSSVEELGDDVPDWCKVLIVQGEDPSDPTKHQSRSEALFAVCCELCRRGLSDDVIYSVITDPDFLISSSVLDKGARAEAYAVRQIARAREEAEDPLLREMNDRYAVIETVGGKCVVVEEVPSDDRLRRMTLARQSFAEFEKRFCNRKVQVGTKKDGVTPVFEKLGKWWLNHPRRRQYHRIVFAPGREVDGSYNLWRGFSCEALPGDCGLLVDHIRENVCQGHEEYYDYLMNWMARAVQRPGEQGHVAVVIRGGRGTGKSFFAQAFGSIWGRHFMQVGDPKHLVGSFNQHLRDCVLLFADEAFYAGDRKHESVLKTIVTEPTLTIEAKGIDAESGPNYLHLIMASNEDWVVPAGFRERRFFVLDVSARRARDTEYFAAIQAQMDSGGREALLHMLLRRDISEFDVRAVPDTAALLRQQKYTMGGLREWWRDKLWNGAILDEHEDWEETVPEPSLVYDLRSYAAGFGKEKFTATSLLLFLQDALPKGYPKPIRLASPREVRLRDGNLVLQTRPRCFRVPPLAECRAHWERYFESGVEWPEVGNEENS